MYAHGTQHPQSITATKICAWNATKVTTIVFWVGSKGGEYDLFGSCSMLTFVHDLGQVTFSVRIFSNYLLQKRIVAKWDFFTHQCVRFWDAHEKKRKKEEGKRLCPWLCFLFLYMSFGTCCGYIVPFESSIVLLIIIAHHEFVAQLKDLV